MRIAVAQLGARMHYAVPRIFHEAGLLERLFTDFYVGNKRWLETALRAIPPRARPPDVDRWLGRRDPAIPPRKVTSFELVGFRGALGLRGTADGPARARFFAEQGGRFNARIIRHGLGRADTVWAFNGGGLELFRWAKRRGLRCILEQTIVPRRIQRELLEAEQARWPGWQPAAGIPAGFDPLQEREEGEWALADQIIAGAPSVVSALVACGVPPDRCTAVPYGVEAERFAPAPRADRRRHARLRVLFVGEVGLRKGAPYVLEAARRLGPERVEARFVGHVALDPAKLAPYRPVAAFLGAVPRARMPEMYAWADVLALPSVCEGSATATYEALASRLPVVCTPNAGAPVRDGMDGVIVPAGDVDALVGALLAAPDLPIPSSAPATGLAAYGRRLVAAVCGEERAA